MNKQTTNKETQAMNKIVLYGFNYESNFIQLVWGVETPLTNHFKNKFSETGNFFNFYMQLSETNKDLLNNHILNTNL